MQPLISILIPVYNVELYIEKCLRSLFANTIIDKCEIIIIDDCSPDLSMKIAERVLEDYEELKDNVFIIHHKENSGVAAARKTAIAKARGEYFIYIDSDDWVEPNYLEELYNKAESEDCDIVGCDLYSEFSNKTIIKEQPLENNNLDCIRDMLSAKTNGWLWIKMIRRNLVIENKISWIDGINICEDVLFSVKCFYYAQKIGYVNKPLYHYNHNLGSYMHTLINDKSANQIVSAISEIEQFLLTKNEANLLDEMKLQKLHLKSRILFKGNKDVRIKYLSLWPEANTRLCDFETSKIRKIILHYSINAPKIAAFFLFVLYAVKRISGRNLFIK